VVQSSNEVANVVVEFHRRLGIGRSRESLEARRWADAATEVRDRALETGADGVDAARRLGNDTFGRAKWATGKLSSRISELTLRRGKDEDDKTVTPPG
jgi:hypothetical protein